MKGAIMESNTLSDRAVELEEMRRAALISGDATALESLVCSEAVYVHANGTPITGAQWVADLARGAFRYDSISTSEQSVTVRGGTVALTFAQDSVIRFGGEAHHSSTRSTSVWAEEAGELKLVAYQTSFIEG